MSDARDSSPAAAPPTPVALTAIERLPVRLCLFLLIALASYGPSVFECVRCGGTTPDWQFFQFFDELARQYFLRWHQFPIWNPYQCGGASFIGNPQTTFLVPTWPLVLVFGTTLGERLSNLAVLVVAAEGGYRLMRQLRTRPWPALLVAVTYPFFGRTMGWFHDGQYGLLGMGLSLWVLYGFLRGIERPVYLVLGGAFLAWMIAFRGIQPGPQLALGLGLWALALGLGRLRDGKGIKAALWPLAALAIVGMTGLGLAGIRMAPVLTTVLAHQRVVEENTSRLLSDAWVHFYGVSPVHYANYRDAGYAYVGLVPYLLGIAALFVPRLRTRAAIPISLFCLYALITMGYHGNFSPFPYLKLLPLYRSLRNPALYSFTGALFLVIAAGLSADELAAWLEKQRYAILRFILPLVVVGTCCELTATARWYMRHHGNAFAYPPIAHVTDDFHQTRGNRFEMPIYAYIDRGSLSCYDETPWPASPRLRPDLAAEEYLADPSAGTVARAAWTPQRIDLDVILEKPARLFVNQNWASGWRASQGTVVNVEGLLAVDLPAGSYRLTLRVLPTVFLVGIAWSLLTLAFAVWMVRRDRAERASRKSAPSSTP